MTNSSKLVEDDLPSSFKGALPSLFFLTSIFWLNFTSRILFSPFLPVISEELGLSHADSGSFFLCISSGYFVSILLSGHVSSRIGYRWCIVLSSLGSGSILLLISLSDSLLALRAGLVCLGLAAGLYLPSGLVTISRLVPPAYAVRGLAVHELAPNLSFVLTPLICATALVFMPWRTSLVAFAMVMMVQGTLFYLYGYSHPGKGTAPRFTVLYQILRLPEFWLITLMFSMAICSTLGIYTMLPLFLVSERGMDLESANTLVAFSRIASVCMPLVGGWLGDRFGNRIVVGGVLAVGGVLTVPIGITYGSLMTSLVVLQPMVAVCFFPSAFAFVSEIGPREHKNVAVSLCIPLAFLCGGGILPTIIGIIGDYFSLGAGITTAGSMMVVASVCCLGILEKRNQQ